jgi:flavodoxin
MTIKENEEQEIMNLKEEKCLIAYFSREGNNYVGGRIVNLPIGNTEVVAKKELNNNARPELSNHVQNMDSYNVIFLGYPNWWGTMPMAVFTFLEEYDFSGKNIIPFCTHEGSGLGHSESDIKKLCPNANVQKGLSIRGGSVKGAKNDISRWLQK